MNPTMMEYARVAKMQLEDVPKHLWAVWFVELRMQFSRRFLQGPCSTAHGADFFDNVLAGPENWTEPGEYGNNFRKLGHDSARD